MTVADLEAALAAGSPVLHAAFVLAAALAWLAQVAADSRDWQVREVHRSGFLAAIALGALAGSVVPALAAGGLVGELALRTALAPRSVLGGLAGGFLAAALYKRVFALRWESADAFVRGTILAMAIGRLGCQARHCCLGIACAPLGLDYGDGRPRLPVQLVEAALLFAFYAAFTRLHRRGAWRDRRLFLFFVAYGLARTGLEFLREPVGARLAGLDSYQWMALALAGLGAYQLRRRGAAVEAGAPTSPPGTLRSRS